MSPSHGRLSQDVGAECASGATADTSQLSIFYPTKRRVRLVSLHLRKWHTYTCHSCSLSAGSESSPSPQARPNSQTVRGPTTSARATSSNVRPVPPDGAPSFATTPVLDLDRAQESPQTHPNGQVARGAHAMWSGMQPAPPVAPERAPSSATAPQPHLDRSQEILQARSDSRATRSSTYATSFSTQPVMPVPRERTLSSTSAQSGLDRARENPRAHSDSQAARGETTSIHAMSPIVPLVPSERPPSSATVQPDLDPIRENPRTHSDRQATRGGTASVQATPLTAQPVPPVPPEHTPSSATGVRPDLSRPQGSLQAHPHSQAAKAGTANAPAMSSSAHPVPQVPLARAPGSATAQPELDRSQKSLQVDSVSRAASASATSAHAAPPVAQHVLQPLPDHAPRPAQAHQPGSSRPPEGPQGHSGSHIASGPTTSALKTASSTQPVPPMPPDSRSAVVREPHRTPPMSVAPKPAPLQEPEPKKGFLCC